MKKLSRNEGVAVGAALVFTFGVLFFGSLIFGPAGAPQKASSVADQSSGATVSAPNLPAGHGVQDLLVGAGAGAKTGDKVSVNYTGMLTNGVKFDSSYNRGQPLTFTVGGGQLIKGFDDGVVGMKVGGKRRLTIPPNLGYGANPAGPIPADSTLVFDVEMVSIGK